MTLWSFRPGWLVLLTLALLDPVHAVAPAITVVAPPTVSVVENGGDVLYQIVLTAAPTNIVTVPLVCVDPTQATVQPTSLTFLTTNWFTPQNVRVRPVDDVITDGTVVTSITHGPAVSVDAAFNGISGPPQTVEVDDDDLPSVAVVPATLPTVMINEPAASGTFTLNLGRQPTVNVVINIVSSNPLEGTCAPAALTFTTVNWAMTQVVTATAVDDVLLDGTQTFQCLTSIATADVAYSAYNPPDADIAVADDEVPGVLLSATAVTTDEALTLTPTYTIELQSAPTSAVSIPISVAPAGTEATVSPALVAFTPGVGGNWNVPVLITVTGIDDFINDGDVNYVISHGPTISAQAAYNGITPMNIMGVNLDNDVPDVIVNPTTGLITTETPPGGPVTFTIKLGSQPTADVDVNVASLTPTEGTVIPPSVRFTTGTNDWKTPQLITVTGVDETVVDGAQVYEIDVQPAASADPDYLGVDGDNVFVTNTDDDVVGMTITPTVVMTSEAGTTAMVSFALNTQPAQPVQVNLVVGDTTEGSINPGVLTFPNGVGWNTPQLLTITGLPDLLIDGPVTYTISTTITSLDPIYAAYNPVDITVTNADTSTPGITITPLAGITTTEAAGAGRTATFDVSLITTPAAQVTLTFTSGNLLEGTIMPTVLVFTAANVVQTITITGVDDLIDDGDVTYQITAAAVSADPDYSGIASGPVTVINIDDETAMVVCTPLAIPAISETEPLPHPTFECVLTSQPTANVQIDFTADLTEVTMNPTVMVFTPLNWMNPIQITVSPVDEFDLDGDQNVIINGLITTTDVNYGPLAVPAITILVQDNEVPGIIITRLLGLPLTPLTTTEAGGTDTFQLSLGTPPSANVVLGITFNPAAEINVSPTSVTITPAGWNTPQPVTVTGLDDTIVDGNIPFTVTIISASADLTYNGLAPTTATGLNMDNDVPAIIVTPAAGLITNEDMTLTAQFTVVLQAEPTAAVQIPTLVTSDATEGTCTPSTLNFNAGNWKTPQVVTVSGVDDNVVDGDTPYQITIAAATSVDPAYAGLASVTPNVGVLNQDNDAPGVRCTFTGGAVTSEPAVGADVSCVLDTVPTANVVINLATSVPGEGIPVPTFITITPGGWNVPEVFTVQGVDDFVIDGPQLYDLTFTVASGDPNYNAIAVAAMQLTNQDDDSSAYDVVTPTGPVTTDEAGVLVAATFTIAMKAQPTAPVTINLRSSDPGEGTVAPASITFTTAGVNWKTPQVITVTGVDDNLPDGDINYLVVTDPAISADVDFTGVVPQPGGVQCVNLDDDLPEVEQTGVAGTINEGGAEAEVEMRLRSEPVSAVVLNFAVDLGDEASLSHFSHTFTPGDWMNFKTLTITGLDDPEVDGDIAVLVSTTVASTDLAFNGIAVPDVPLTNFDDDVAGLVFNPTLAFLALNPLTTTEAGGQAFVDITLASQPSANVVASLTALNPNEGTVSPATHTWTPTNWANPHRVIVTGVDDFVADGDAPYQFRVEPAASADLDYAGLTAVVDCLNVDDETPGITITPIMVTIPEAGGTAQFSVWLNTQPTSDVQLPLASLSLPDGTLSAASVTFKVANYKDPQVVTITAVDDDFDNDGTTFTVLTSPAVSADPTYGGMDPADVQVDITDDDDVGVIVSPVSGLVTSEAAGPNQEAEYTIKLAARPTAAVTVDIQSLTNSEGFVNAGALLNLEINPGDWNTLHTVTVTGNDDNIGDGDILYVVENADTRSADADWNGLIVDDVALTNLDDEVIGLVLSTAACTTREDGTMDTVTVKLSSEPTASVNIPVTSARIDETTVALGVISIKAADWNVPQPIVLTGQPDDIQDGDQTFTVDIGLTTSADPNYRNQRVVGGLTCTNQDIDVAGLEVQTPGGVTTAEAGGGIALKVRLQTQPTAVVNVNVDLAGIDATEGAATPASLMFTQATWNNFQMITVTGVDDDLVDGPITYGLGWNILSADPVYNNIAVPQTMITNTDNDIANVNVNPMAGLMTTEAGGQATFTITLLAEPMFDVVFTVSTDNAIEGIATPASVTFRPADWNLPKVVTVVGQQDLIEDGNVNYNVIMGTGMSLDPAFNGLSPASVALTNLDDDTAGVILLPATLGTLTVHEAATTETFQVVLETEPTNVVQFTVATNDAGESSVFPNSIQFTSANWNVPQQISVTGVDDSIVDGTQPSIITVGPSVSVDANYNGVTLTVNVGTEDDDSPGIFMDPGPTVPLTVSEALLNSVTFTVVLQSMPTAPVTLVPRTSDTSEGTILPASVTFKPALWNAPQVVTVTGVNDDIDDGDVTFQVGYDPSMSADADYAGLFGGFDVVCIDDDTAGIDINPKLVTVVENGVPLTATFTATCLTEPATPLQFSVTSSDGSEGTVSPTTIIFDNTNWKAPQAVQLTAVDDLIADGTVSYTLVTGIVTGDTAFAGINPDDVTAQTQDNESPGISVTPVAGLATDEGAATDLFNVVLNTKPTADVIVPITHCVTGDVGEVTAAPCSLTFKPSDWNVQQPVTVRGVNDDIADGNQAVTVVIGAASSIDAGYQGMDPADVGVVNVDDDVAGVSVVPLAGLTTDETGMNTMTEFTVKLDTEPTAVVTCNVASLDPSEGSVNPTQLRFSPGDWKTLQTVYVSAQDDSVVDGTVSYTIDMLPCTSLDPSYHNFDPNNPQVDNNDDDTLGITISPATLQTIEQGATKSFSVVLKSQPVAPVTFRVVSSNTNEGTVSSPALTFSVVDWGTPQPIIVTPVDDFDIDGTITYTLQTGLLLSADPSYQGINPPDIPVDNLDNDVAGYIISAPTTIITSEAGTEVEFTVVLTSRPTSAVNIPVTSSAPLEGIASPMMFAFNNINWKIPVTVTVTGQDEAVDDGDQMYLLGLGPIASADADYNGMTIPNVDAINVDDDASQITVSKFTITTDETGLTDTFTVKLNTKPTADVTVPITIMDSSEGLLPTNPALTMDLIFAATGTGWSTPQVVTVTGEDDTLPDGNFVYEVRIGPSTSADAGYVGLSGNTVVGTNNDNDVATISVTPNNVNVLETGETTAVVVLVLAAQPSNDVVANVNFDTVQVRVSPNTFRFTPVTWANQQTMTVTGVDDNMVDGNVVSNVVLALSSVDPLFAASPDVTVFATIIDNDVPQVDCTPTTGLETSESGDRATMRCKLSHMPAAAVTIFFSSNNGAEGTVQPPSLTFLQSDWNVEQDVFITGVQDLGAQDGNVLFGVDIGPTVSADLAWDALPATTIQVTNKDDDTPGVIVNPSAGLETDEFGNFAEFTVKLATAPTAAVTVDIFVADPGEGTPDRTELVFGTGTWMLRQTVRVTGVDDTLIDGDEPYIIAVSPGGSLDASYNSFATVNVNAVNRDNDAVGLDINQLTVPWETTEWGTEVEFTINLRSIPVAIVTVPIQSTRPLEGDVSVSTLNFDATNWNVPVTVTVTGRDDAVDDDDQAYAIMLGPLGGADPNYSVYGSQTLSLLNIDDEPVRPNTCATYLDMSGVPLCALVASANTVYCGAGGCDAAQCCVTCAGFPASTCASGTLVANPATVTCANPACDTGTCCRFDPAPPGAQFCTSHTGCQLVNNPALVWCPLATGCTDAICCANCAAYDASTCASGLLRADAATTACAAGGCDGNTCCRPSVCFGVMCNPPTQCHQQGTCASCTPMSCPTGVNPGDCSALLKAAGTPCDDGDATTIQDVCDNTGSCVGQGKCAGVVCAARDDCHFNGVCDPTTGMCSEPMRPNGSPCNDGNAATSTDTCNSGVCSGVITCGGVQCPRVSTNCMQPACVNSGGVQTCVELPLADGVPCDDRSPSSFNDVCQLGSCVGTDLCLGTFCSPVGQCYAPGECTGAGVCTTPLLADMTPCDDSDPLTRDDYCWRGTCIGIPKCSDVICTASDACHQVGVCEPTTGLCTDPPMPAGTPCNDMQATTGPDTCDGAGACVGAVVCGGAPCAPSEPQCHVASCDGAACTEFALPDGMACNDGDIETDNDQCQGGVCRGSSSCTTASCLAPDQCHAQGACAAATGRCNTVFQPDMTPCNDANVRTKSDVCLGGLCLGQPRCVGVVCPPSGVCRQPGTCNPNTGLCSDPMKPDGLSCSDDNAATVNDMCTSGVCIGVVICGAAECRSTDPQCKRAACVSGRCTQTNVGDGTPCNDNNPLTYVDTCSNGMCIGESKCAGVVCPVLDTCHEPGVCDYATGLCETAGPPLSDGTPCDDGDIATTNDRCNGGKCIGVLPCGGIAACVSEDQCHEPGVCIPASGLCDVSYRSDGSPCNDGIAGTTNDRCITGSCVGQLMCGGVACLPSAPQCMISACNGATCEERPKPDGTDCNDDDPATINDRCTAGVCSGTNRCAGVVCTQVSDCHDAGVCHPATGICSTLPKEDGSPCDDSQPATVDDKCFNGECIGVDKCAGVTCPSRGPCYTSGTCSPTTGLCEDALLADLATCNDGDSSTTDDKCYSGTCVGTVQCGGSVCPLGDPQCHYATCVANTCGDRPKPDGTECSDGNLQTIGDTCQGGTCQPGVNLCAGVVCMSAAPCYGSGVCHPATGVCDTPVLPDNTPCDDGNAATRDDVCTSSVCVGVDRCAGVTCAAQDGCHTDGVCDSATGLCSEPVRASGSPCDDGNVQTFGDVCIAGVCTGTLPCGGLPCMASQPECNVPTCTGSTCGQAPLPDGTQCSDGMPHTLDDRCIAGVCVGEDKCDGIVCNNDVGNTCAMPGTCEPTTGRCPVVVLADATLCNDGDASTSLDNCQAGACVGIAKCSGVVCTAVDGCHLAGVCSPLTGVCTQPLAADGIACDDANLFSTSDRCQAGTCVGVTVCGGVTCPAGDGECRIAVCAAGACSVTNRPDGAVCNDGNPSTSTDRCQAGVCVGLGPCVGVTCPATMCEEAGVCDPNTGQCAKSPKPDNTPCDDGDAATIDDTCWRGVCTGKGRCEGVACEGSGQCTGAGTCGIGTGECTYPNFLDGTLCNDAEPTTHDDRCSAGVCSGAVLCAGVQCRAANPQCNNPTCSGSMCVELPKADGTPCDDGNDGTKDDSCQAGTCVGTSLCAGVVCTAAGPCYHAGVCDPSTGTCTTPVKTDGTACDDNNPSSQSSVCQGGMCVSNDLCQGQTPCEAASGCHDAGTCDPATGVCTTPLKIDASPCDDGNSATAGDVCTAGVCAGRLKCDGVVCAASDACHSQGICDPTTGLCSDPRVPDGTFCNDGNAQTTTDVCQSGVCVGSMTCGFTTCKAASPSCNTVSCTSGTCVEGSKAQGTACNDDNALTQSDSCMGGMCRGRPLCEDVSCQPTQCTNPGTCDPATGKCINGPKPDGTPCDDGNAQTYADRCVNGRCSGERRCNGVVCPARSQCHLAGACDLNSGACTSPAKPDGAGCDDLRAETTDSCLSGVCVGTIASCGGATCAPSNLQCGEVFCVANACMERAKADGTACDDGDPSTQNDICKLGACQGTDPCLGVMCAAFDDCHGPGVCEPLTGTCSSPMRADSSYCDDGNANTDLDVCTAGVCFGSDRCQDVICNPSDNCHVAGVCDSATGMCTDPVAPNGAVCDDGHATTFQDVCSDGACAGSIICNGQRCLANDPQCNVPMCAPNGRDCDQQTVPDGTPCNDNDMFTQNDRCDTGVCKGVSPCAGVVCEVLDQCHDRSECDPRTGICTAVPMPDGTLCDDGDQNTRQDQCVAGTCQGLPKCAGVICAAVDACHDQGVCDPFTGLCSEPMKQAGTPCDDFNANTLNDRCVWGICVGEVPCGSTSCVPANPQCSTMSCVAQSCVEQAKPNGAQCNDQNVGTFQDTCHSGLCKGQDKCSGVVCTSIDGCHLPGTCDPATGQCSVVLKADKTPCDDGNPETHFDQCQKGTCAGLDLCSGVSCGASDSCHEVGVCNPSTGVCSDPLKATGTSCSDGDSLTTLDTCKNGACGGSITCGASECEAPDPSCRRPICQDNECAYENKADGTPCNDNSKHTINDACSGGLCVGIDRCDGVVCSPVSQCHLPGRCNPQTGLCSIVIKPDAMPCDDQDVMTIGDQCLSGTCMGIGKCDGVVCTATDSCHAAGTCDPNTGMCMEPRLQDGTLCNDGDLSTMGDECNAGVCSGYVPCGGSQCRAASPACNRAVCVGGTQCREQPKLDGLTCNDNDFTTVNDQCTGGVCEGTNKCAGVTCSALGQCHFAGDCEPATGTCTHTVKGDDTPCDDGVQHTRSDVCTVGTCVGISLCHGVTCNGGPCHYAGQCDHETGECTRPLKPEGALCDDGNGDTFGDRCESSQCIGATKTYCGSFVDKCTVPKTNPDNILCKLWEGCDVDTCCDEDCTESHRSVCEAGDENGAQTCFDPTPAVLDDWVCQCKSPLTGEDGYQKAAACSPPGRANTDIILTGGTGTLAELKQKVADMAGVDPDEVVVTTEGTSGGEYRVILPSDTARETFLGSVVDCNAACQAAGLGDSVDLVRTRCDALELQGTCQQKRGCAFEQGRCIPSSAAANPDDDDDDFPWWGIALIILGICCLLGLIAALLNKKQKKKRDPDQLEHVPIDAVQNNETQALYDPNFDLSKTVDSTPRGESPFKSPPVPPPPGMSRANPDPPARAPAEFYSFGDGPAFTPQGGDISPVMPMTPTSPGPGGRGQSLGRSTNHNPMLPPETPEAFATYTYIPKSNLGPAGRARHSPGSFHSVPSTGNGVMPPSRNHSRGSRGSTYNSHLPS